MQYGISKLVREPPPADDVGDSGQSTHPSHTAAR